MIDNIVAVTAIEARSAGERAISNGEDKRAVVLAVMRASRSGFMAPDEGKAFCAAIAALWELYPADESLRQETKAIGDRNKTLQAIIGGVPVDMAALTLTPMPENPLGLLDLWRESA